MTLVSGKRDTHRRLHVYPAFPIKAFFSSFLGGKQRLSRKWLSDLKKRYEVRIKLTHQLEICRGKLLENGKYRETPQPPTLIKSSAILKLNMADHMVRIRY